MIGDFAHEVSEIPEFDTMLTGFVFNPVLPTPCNYYFAKLGFTAR